MYLLDVHLENGKAPRRDRRDEGLPGEESGDVLADQADSRNGLRQCQLLHLQTGHPPEKNLAALGRKEGIVYLQVECVSCERAKMVNKKIHERGEHVATRKSGAECAWTSSKESAIRMETEV